MICCQIKEQETFHLYGIWAEWHFYSMVLGKGVCDGLVGTVKKLTAHASLQSPYVDQNNDTKAVTWMEVKENIPFT